MLFTYFQIGRIDGLARLALKAFDLDKLCGVFLVLPHSRFQFRTLSFGKRIVEQGGLTQHCRIKREVLLTHLSEHLLPQPIKLILQTGDLTLESLNLRRLCCYDFLFRCHLFRSSSIL